MFNREFVAIIIIIIAFPNHLNPTAPLPQHQATHPVQCTRDLPGPGKFQSHPNASSMVTHLGQSYDVGHSGSRATSTRILVRNQLTTSSQAALPVSTVSNKVTKRVANFGPIEPIWSRSLPR